uniref:Protein S100 n=2 Tax=Leptobrachium leishanense TaxID=445787 RepID=A0A8C5Q0T7_9ANUR
MPLHDIGCLSTSVRFWTQKKYINSIGMSSTELKTAISLLVGVFDTYSKKEGDSSTLSRKELKDLLQSELGDALAVTKNPSQVDNILKDLDFNGDGQVDFTEYMVLVGALAMSCYEFFQQS